MSIDVFKHSHTRQKNIKCAYRAINKVSYHFNVAQNIPVTSELLPQTEWRLPLAR
jgi:hypothetical protein